MKRIRTIITVLAILVLCGTARADDLHVPAGYNTIQAAIDAAVDGDVVIVADGNYIGPGNKNLDFAGRAITVSSQNGREATIIDCENDGRGFYFHSGEDSNSVLEGFTITRGAAYDGGAVECNDSSPVIKDCIFTSNSASHNGGGVALISSSALVMNCLFRNNRGRIHAGAMSCIDSEALVQDCVFHENSTYSYSADGGAMLIAGKPSPTVMNCLFAANQTDRDGGGGGIRNYRSSPTIINCTFVNNDSEGGGAIANAPDCSVSMVNCILWANTAGYYGGHEMLNDDDSHANVSHCDIMGGWNGPRVRNNDTSSVINGGGNINADPLFVAGPLGDYYLSQIAAGQASDSNCVDAGSDLASALGLDIYTTRTDQIPDTSIVDIGYHYTTTWYEIAISSIENAISEKLDALDTINAAIDEEQIAHAALQEMLDAAYYAGLSSREIAAAQRDIEFAVRRQKRSRRVLLESIETLESALLELGIEPEPSSLLEGGSAPKRQLQTVGKPAPAVIKKPQR